MHLLVYVYNCVTGKKIYSLSGNFLQPDSSPHPGVFDLGQKADAENLGLEAPWTGGNGPSFKLAMVWHGLT